MVLRPSRCPTLLPGLFEQLHDLFVGGLVEVLVPEAYGPEVGGSGQADQLVHPGLEEFRRLGGANGCGQDQASWLPQSQGFDGGAGRHAGGEAVVDQDRGPTPDLRLGPPAPEKAQPPVYLGDLRAVIRSTYSSGMPRRLMTSAFKMRTPPAATAPMPNSGWPGAPSLRETNTSSGAPREREISYPTGTPPRGNPKTTHRPPRKRDSFAASFRPASLRSSNGGERKILTADQPTPRQNGARISRHFSTCLTPPAYSQSGASSWTPWMVAATLSVRACRL